MRLWPWRCTLFVSASARQPFVHLAVRGRNDRPLRRQAIVCDVPDSTELGPGIVPDHSRISAQHYRNDSDASFLQMVPGVDERSCPLVGRNCIGLHRTRIFWHVGFGTSRLCHAYEQAKVFLPEETGSYAKGGNDISRDVR